MSYPTYSTFLPTRWPEVATVPTGWDVRRLKFAVTLRSEKAEADEAGREYLALEHIEPYTGRRLEDDSVTSEGIATLFEPGDVLFSKLRPYLAKVYAADKRGMATTELLVMVAEPVVLPSFLKFLLLSGQFIDAVSGSTYGAKMPRANWDMIGCIPAVLPSIAEQVKITAFVTWKTDQIDALTAKKRALIEALREERLAVVTRAVTKGLDPLISTRQSAVPWLGDIPEHWEVVPLGFLIHMTGGMTPSMANADYWDGDIPWVTPKDMKQSLIDDSIDHVSQQALVETGLALVQPNTILVVVRGMILAHSFPTAIAAAPVTINQDMKALTCGERLHFEYLFWCLTGFAAVLSNMAQESAHGTRKMETITLKKFAFPVPPVAEQIRIAEATRTRVSELDAMAAATADAIDKLTEYRSALITAAVTGQIDVRGIAIGGNA